MSHPARKTLRGLVLLGSLIFAVSTGHAAPSGGCVVGATTTCTFNYTGAPEAWVVPPGVTSAVFDLYGAAGGSFPVVTGAPFPAGAAGKGAHVQATVTLTPGETLSMRVGGVGQDGGQFNLSGSGTVTIAGGFNGGGSTSLSCSSACGFFMGAAGGGSSDVRMSADGLADRVLVAGGGGGAGPGGANTNDPGDGGNSATAAKSVTGALSATCSGGGPGTLLAPGAPGAGSGCVSGQGGDPGGLTGGGDSDFIGAGGGGYFGGGAGARSSQFVAGSGGGGGSDYPNPLSPPVGTSNVTVTDGVRTGNGLITVTYTTPGLLQICKIAGIGVSAGTNFTFTVGTSTFTVPAGPAEQGGFCVNDGTFAAGTDVTVTETIPIGIAVTEIAVSAPAIQQSLNLAAGTVTMTIGSGANRVTYTDSAVSSVRVTGLTATRSSRSVILRWHTGTDADLLGFHVYRSRGDSWQRVSHSLITAKGSVSGASYRFLDKSANRGIAYRFRIKAVNQDGTASWFGPVRVT